MPRHPDRPSALAWQVFRASEAIRLGLVTAHKLRSSAWVNLRRDIYADSRLDLDHTLACRAASLQLPPGSALAGPSAALLYGVEHAAEFSDEVHVASPRTAGLRSQRGLRVHLTDLRPATSPPVPAALLTPVPLPAPDPLPVAAPLSPNIALSPHVPLSAHSSLPALGPATIGVAPSPAPGAIRTAPQPRDATRSTPPPRDTTRTGPQPCDTTRSTPRPRDAARAGPQIGRDAVGVPGGVAVASVASVTGVVSVTGVAGVAGRPEDPTVAGAAPIAVAAAAWALPRTDPATAAWETAVWLEPLRAVGIVDSLLRKGLTTRDSLTAIGVRNADRPGGRRARWVFGLADPGAQSPPESELRVRLVLAGLPRPVARHPVRLASGLVLHPGLAWPEFRVAVEYDGDSHADAEQLHRDRWRLNQLVCAGWIVLHASGRRLRHDSPALTREVHAALAARGWRR
ncbi:endonuclease domain-containing protein [Micromonospora rubida]|uniref:endonuclease domain-containing protein n=1 Tax=Micromonospora rubida TaxID=2697657 RepID=UPI0013775E80|nr:hypothetical protein [Micromonospora rubida]NBE81109.1 hypothetical protein [Micromonospora rubida]